MAELNTKKKPATAKSAAAVKPALNEPEKTTTTVVSNCRLYNPHQKIRFSPGIPVEIQEVTGWTQSQIDAGLMKTIG